MVIPILETIVVSARPSGVCLIEFNRLRRGNAFSDQLCRDWNTALKWAFANDDIKIVVQTGRGKYYTTGMDLGPKILEEMSFGDVFLQNLFELLETMINSSKPLISAVNGPAIGIGATSLGLSDLVYSVPHATFHTPFMRWGLAAEGCSSVIFPLQLGYSKAAALLIAGETLTAEEMWIGGLVTRIFPAEGFMDEVMEVAERMAGYSQSAIRTTRELLRHKLRNELHAANLAECQALRERFANNDAMPNILAFIEEQRQKKAKKQNHKL